MSRASERHSLDRLKVEHRPIPARGTFTFELPLPPSTNGLFDGPRRARPSSSYRDWRKEAAEMLMAQGGARSFHGRVAITVTLADRGQGDPDNRLKALFDFCVFHGIIDNDDRKTVREIHVLWGANIAGARVEIQSLENAKAAA